jgi:hypothetical protein
MFPRLGGGHGWAANKAASKRLDAITQSIQPLIHRISSRVKERAIMWVQKRGYYLSRKAADNQKSTARASNAHYDPLYGTIHCVFVS